MLLEAIFNDQRFTEKNLEGKFKESPKTPFISSAVTLELQNPSLLSTTTEYMRNVLVVFAIKFKLHNFVKVLNFIEMRFQKITMVIDDP